MIEECKLIYNQLSGIILNASEYPSEQTLFKMFKQGESSSAANLFNSPQGGSAPRKMNTTVSASNISFGGGRVAPTSLFEET